MSQPFPDHPFVDPYEGLSKSDINNTTIEVSRADHGYIYSLFPTRSVLQTTINILLSRFVAACKEHGFKQYDPYRYREAIATVEISIPVRTGGAVAGVDSRTDTNQPVEANRRDDGRGTGEVGHVNKGLPVAASDNASGVSRGGKQKKAAKTKGT